MKWLITILIFVSFYCHALPRWIAKVPIYPPSTLFDPQLAIDECIMYGNMAQAVQEARRETQGDSRQDFLVLMPEAIRDDNEGVKQPIIEWMYSRLSEWIWDNYRQDDTPVLVYNDYLVQCTRQSMPEDMAKWWRLKEKDVELKKAGETGV